MSTAFSCIFIQPETFFENETGGGCNGDKVTSLVNSIIDKHECFSTTYKYAPSKDQNLLNKLRSQKKLYKSKIIPEDADSEQRNILGILNKLTDANFGKLLKKISNVLDSDDSVVRQFSREMMNFCTLSETNIHFVVKILENTSVCEQHREIFEDSYRAYITKYTDDVTPSSLEERFSHMDYENYDDFCAFTKFSKNVKNCLKAMIRISKVFDYDVEPQAIYRLHADNIEHFTRRDLNHRHLFLYNSLEHIEYILTNTDVLNTVDLDNLKRVCNEATEEFESKKKIVFKIQDILEKISI